MDETIPQELTVEPLLEQNKWNIPFLLSHLEKALSQSNDAALWLRWAQWELTSDDLEWLEWVLNRGLKEAPCCVGLWRLYLELLCRQHPLAGRTEASTALLVKAHDLAIQQAGHSIDALPLHRMIIELHQQQPAHGQYQIDQIRKLYQRALCLPLLGVEALWQDYDRWEQELNRVVGKRIVGERSQAYMLARSHIQELQHCSQLDLMMLPPPIASSHSLACFRFALPPHLTHDAQRAAQGMQWILWEQQNPLGLEPAIVQARCSFAFRQLSAHLLYYPEFWYRWARYCQSLGKLTEAESTLRQGMIWNPHSPLLCCLLADLISADEHRRPELEDRQEQSRLVFEQAIAQAEAADNLTLLYIQWMQHARRSESMAAARLVFSRARKDERAESWQLYVAAAKMEWFGRKEAVVAGKIFELGMQRHATRLDYVLEYLDYLIHQNDDQNTRALFERALQSIEAEADRLELWKRYLDYEFLYGDRVTILALQTRFKESFPHLTITDDLSLSIRQYGYADLMPVPERAWALLRPSETAADQNEAVEISTVSPEPQHALQLPAPHVFPFPLLGDEVVCCLLRLPCGSWDGPRLHTASLLRALLFCFRQPTPAPAAPPVASKTGAAPSKAPKRSTRPNRAQQRDYFEPVPLGRNRGDEEKDLLGERFSGRLKQ